MLKKLPPAKNTAPSGRPAKVPTMAPAPLLEMMLNEVPRGGTNAGLTTRVLPARLIGPLGATRSNESAATMSVTKVDPAVMVRGPLIVMIATPPGETPGSTVPPGFTVTGPMLPALLPVGVPPELAMVGLAGCEFSIEGAPELMVVRPL